MPQTFFLYKCPLSQTDPYKKSIKMYSCWQWETYDNPIVKKYDYFKIAIYPFLEYSMVYILQNIKTNPVSYKQHTTMPET